MLAAIVLCVVYPKIADSKPLDNTADIQNTAAVETDPALFTDYLHWINNDEELESGLKSFYDSTGIMPYLYLTGKTNGKRSVTEADIGDYTYNLYDELFTNDDGQVDENRILVVYLHYDDVYASSCVTGIQAESVLGDEGRKILLDDIGQYHLKYKDSSEWFAAAFRDAGETICKRLNIVNGSNGNPGEPQGENLGTLKLLEDLNIRTGPGTGYSTTGVLKKGNTAKYYEVKSADGYTWYRIGDNSWIADDGTWITTDSSYVNSGESQSESVDTLITLEDLNIRTGPGTGYNITGVLKKGSKANFYEAKNADGYFWYRISDNEWIADDGTWISIFGNGNVSVENVIDIAKQHATWINDYVASIGANHIGWDCRYVIEDEVYWNYATEVETFIPAGSFQGGYGVYSGSSGWSIYEFAYIKKGNGYEFLDLFRYDKDVSE